MKHFLPVRPKLVAELKKFQNLSKFGTFNISNMAK